MSDAIVLNYQPFDLYSNGIIFKNGEQQNISVPNDGIGMLAEICYSRDIFNLMIAAPDQYINKISRDISMTETAKYSTNKINIRRYSSK